MPAELQAVVIVTGSDGSESAFGPFTRALAGAYASIAARTLPDNNVRAVELIGVDAMTVPVDPPNDGG